MGVLEDAIREHLELKRKHGASDEEVERKEVEALGPARREFEGAADETPEEPAEEELPVPEGEAAEPVVEAQTELEPEPEPPAPESSIAEPATTRLHESPASEPDFAADDEEAAEQSPPRDWDFD